ncbi:uncharacterized protein LOC116202726 [Punica granatum]|uniref:Uncharacterized protein LOC116202726 n=1 Tax=Punica granatum TaxID=22663 RepID=A0A6P8D1D3_PUNGR|nr:uncharacterized protein LOC116202726 [Punica granatum]
MLGGAETVSSGKTRAENKHQQRTADGGPTIPDGAAKGFVFGSVADAQGSRNSRDIANKLCDDVFVWFTHSKEPLYIEDLDEKLDQGLLSLNTEADDGSIGEVAEKLMILHEECSEGNYSSIEKLREACAHRMVHSHVKQAPERSSKEWWWTRLLSS